MITSFSEGAILFLIYQILLFYSINFILVQLYFFYYKSCFIYLEVFLNYEYLLKMDIKI